MLDNNHFIRLLQFRDTHRIYELPCLEKLYNYFNFVESTNDYKVMIFIKRDSAYSCGHFAGF